MNKNLKTENFWIVVAWAIIFMLILTWDQEKIVVLNLVLFCYFLRYLVGTSIEGALGQRRATLLDNLLADLNTQLVLLSKLLAESKVVLNNYRILVLFVLKKVITTTNNFLLINKASTCSAITTDFTPIQLALQVAFEEPLIKQFNQNTFVASQVVLDVSPVFTSELQEGSE